jgi:hypothetical protein
VAHSNLGASSPQAVQASLGTVAPPPELAWSVAAAGSASREASRPTATRAGIPGRRPARELTNDRMRIATPNGPAAGTAPVGPDARVTVNRAERADNPRLRDSYP